MKKTLTAFALVLFTAVTASAGPINFGFETGDTTGWGTLTPGGSATVYSSFQDGDVNNPGPTYSPYEGGYFLVLESGNANVEQLALTSLPFLMTPGETLLGAAAFTTKEVTNAPPYNDVAYAEIIGVNGQIVWSACVLGPCPDAGGTVVGSPYGSTPWQTWTFTNNTGVDATYALKYTVMNTGDGLFNSYALFDAHVPDGGSALALLGLGMIGLSTIRRKLAK